jgi:hypothetical protein
MEEFGFDNILGEQEIETLFTDPEESAPEEPGEGVAETPEENTEDDEKHPATEAVNPEELFGDPEPESVGSGKDIEEQGDAATEKDDGTSPNFYSSIANALAVDGIFLNSDEEAVSKVDSAESLSDLIEAEINSRLDEKQQRISKALDNGVEPSDIKRYENTLSFISTITDAQISEESEKGEQLRRNLIYQDFLNKGYSPEKAQKFTERTIDAGTDVEDAKEALLSNKEYFQGAYNKLLQDAQREADAERAEREKQSEKLKTSLLKDKQLLGDMELSNDVRKKAFDAISKPVYKDPETGQYLTALQKYEMEHRADFLKYAGLLYTITDGFKDFESFTKGKVKKEVRKGLRELEKTLNSTRRSSDGGLRLVTSSREDPESYISKGIKLDF